jgi:hypothetical protein
MPSSTLSERPRVFRAADLLAGMNALALAMNVAGLAGGDSLKVGVDALDPESGAGALVTGALARQVFMTVTGNGLKAGTLDLRAVNSGGGIPDTTYLPIANRWQGGWGVSGGPPANGDFSVACQTDDGATSLIQGPATVPPVSGCAISIAHNNLVAGTTEGWVLGFVVSALGNVAHASVPNVDIYLSYGGGYSPHSWASLTPVTATPASRAYIGTAPLTPGAYNLGLWTFAWTLRTWPLDPAVATEIVNHLGSQDLVLQFGCLQGGAWPGDTVPNVTQAYLFVPGTGGGVANFVCPFYRNVLTFDASNSAHDVTISDLYCEATLVRH